jgi:hypothetical protein
MKRTTGKSGRASATALLCVFAFLIALLVTLVVRLWPELTTSPRFDPAFYLPSSFEFVSLPTATRFDFPLGNENGAFAYNAQRFTENRHLGDDLNGIGGENSDFGDPIFAVADGRVLLARDGGKGWGNIIIVLHAYEENSVRKYVQSYYGHVETMLVRPGDNVRRGQQIATVGTADGAYLAHLHFEMREFITPFVGPGYRADTRGWINPSEFIAKHRGASADDIGRPPLD